MTKWNHMQQLTDDALKREKEWHDKGWLTDHGGQNCRGGPLREVLGVGIRLVDVRPEVALGWAEGHYYGKDDLDEIVEAFVFWQRPPYLADPNKASGAWQVQGLSLMFGTGTQGSPADGASIAFLVSRPKFSPPDHILLESRRADHEVVFAYGSNLDVKQMRKRAPTSRPLLAARLDGHRVVFPRYSENRRGGVAGLVADSGRHVWGGVYELSKTDLDQLDVHEGRAYQRKEVTLRLHGGESLTAWCYLSAPGEPHIPPHQDYLALILEGAESWGLPPSYRQSLQALGQSLR